jgi:hypothetical protein
MLRSVAAVDWTVNLEVAGAGAPITDVLLEQLVDELAAHHAVITGTPLEHPDGEGRYGAQLDVDDASGPVDALDRAIEIFGVAAARAGLPSWPVIVAEVMTVAEQERQLATPVC